MSRGSRLSHPHGRKQRKGKPMDITSLILELVSGAVGGNVAGAAMKEKSLGAVGNSLAGLVGGGLGGTILQSVLVRRLRAAEEWICKAYWQMSAAAESVARFS